MAGADPLEQIEGPRQGTGGHHDACRDVLPACVRATHPGGRTSDVALRCLSGNICAIDSEDERVPSFKAVGAHADPLVGRNAELARIATFLGAELPGAIVLEGEAGIGKTRVWEESVRAASASGFRVLATRAAGAEVQLSFAGLGDLLGGVLDETLPGLPWPQRRALEAALLLEESEGTPPDSRAVALAFLAALRLLCEAAPLVVAVDDLQWLDPPSGGALRFALRRLETEPVALLGTVRGSPGASLPLELERAFGDRLLRVPLDPLSLGALHELLRSRLGLNLSRPALVRVVEVCRGNPFFALELGRELQRRGAGLLPGEPLPTPSDLKQLVRDRIARLPARTRMLVLSTAALPHPTVEILEAAGGQTAEADLERAVRAGVLELEGERVRFTHPLLAAATYSEALPGERRAAHQVLTQAVTDPQERAWHRALAATGASEEIAVELEGAAGHTRRRGAPDSAADLCEQAVRLTPVGHEAARERRTLAAAEYRFLAGDTTRARSLLDAEVRSVPPGRARGRVLLLRARIAHDAEGSQAAVELCERALREPIDDPALEAEAYVSLAAFADVDNRRRAVHAARAIELIERTEDPDPGLYGSALVAYALGEYYVGHGLRREALERAIELEQRSERPRAAWTASSVLGQLLKYTDEYETARERLEAAYKLALDEGDESSIPDLAAHLSELAVWTGHFAAADEYARVSFDVARRAEQGSMRGIALYCCALVDAHLGREASARAYAEEGLVLGRERRDLWLEGIYLWVLGFLELSLGNAEAVEGHLSRADEIADTIGLAEPGQWRFHPDRIEALIQTGALERADALLSRYLARASAVERQHALAAAERCRGLLAAARGDLEGARAALLNSVERYQRLPLPLEHNRALLALGSAERRAQHKRAAREALEKALDSFEQLGAPFWAAKVRSELGRIGGRRAPARGGLSETEAQIAKLAAAGRTNAEIAAELVISPKTVKWNLSKIYRKLGVRSRTELASALASHKQLASSGPVLE
jgi:DNA-binding CsgD family transcriptional regulator